MFVFVYGSLCKGEVDAELLKNSDCLSEQAWVNNSQLVYGPSFYPLLLKREDAVGYGELYEIERDTLEQLDRLKGYENNNTSSLFIREKTVVSHQNGEVEAYVYYYNHEDKGEVVEQGDWKVAQIINQESCYYFAYGSCMDQERFQQNGVSHLFQKIKGGATLENYTLAFSFHGHDGGRADILEKEGEVVEGVLYEVTQEAVTYLYQREGVHSQGYRPTIVWIMTKDGEQVPTLTFTVIEKKTNQVPPLHYAREIHRGGAPYLSPGYMKALEKRFLEELPVDEFRKYLSSKN